MSGHDQPAAQDQPSTTRLVLLVHSEEQIHPEIVRDDLAAVLDSHGYDYEWISAEDATPDGRSL